MTGVGAIPLTFPHWFVSTCRHHDDAVALVDGSVQVTYGELLRRTVASAEWLIDQGLVRGRPVCFAAAPSADYVALLLGCLVAGGVAAPVNTRLAAPEMAAYIDRIRPGLIVSDDAHAELVAPTGRSNSPVAWMSRMPVHESGRDPFAATSARAVGGLLDELAESDPSIIFPTGGTTGLPKGAYTDHRGLQLWIWHVVQGSRRHRHEVELYFSPFFHVSLVVGVFATLFAGGRVVVQAAFDPGAAIGLIRRWGVNRLMGAPTVFAAIGSHPEATEAARGQIRSITVGSTAITAPALARLLEDFPNAAIAQGYGATEYASGVSRADDADLRAGRIDGGGRPIPGCQVRIIDADGVDLGPGEVGEVIVRSPWQTRGYWNQPEESAVTYRSDGFINLGDLGCFDETGWLRIVGRTKEMIITGGENVFPVEVERALSPEPGVAEVVVFGVPDEYWGERVEAAVTVRGDEHLDLGALRSSVRTRLAGYKVPKRIHVVEAIPLTPNNKPDRRALVQRFSADDLPPAVE